MEISEPNWDNSILDIIGVNSLRLEDFQIRQDRTNVSTVRLIITTFVNRSSYVIKANISINYRAIITEVPYAYDK